MPLFSKLDGLPSLGEIFMGGVGIALKSGHYVVADPKSEYSVS